jgi:superfamily II helicase
MTANKAWAFYDAVMDRARHGCETCSADEFYPNAEAFEETGEIVCNACWDDEQAEQARMQREEANDFRRANPLEPDYRRLDR